MLLPPAVGSFALAPNVSFDKYIYRRWAPGDGPAPGTVTCFSQDSQGFIWLGTNKGAVRFDGSNFEIFDKSNTKAIKSNSITSLLVTPDRTLWIGTGGGGLNRMKDGGVNVYTRRHGLSGNYIDAIAGDKHGNLWIGTPEGLNRFKNNRFIHFKQKGALSRYMIRDIYAGPGGGFVVGHRRQRGYLSHRRRSYYFAAGVGILHRLYLQNPRR